MQAYDIMTREVTTTRFDTTIQDVARLLSDCHISGAPVVDDQQRIVGIITVADITDKEGETAGDIMTRHVVSVYEQTPVDEVAQILTGNHFKRVPVVRGDHIVGIISRADIVRMIAGRWFCPVCGEIQRGPLPDHCHACGTDGTHFEREVDPRLEITSRE